MNSEKRVADRKMALELDGESSSSQAAGSSTKQEWDLSALSAMLLVEGIHSDDMSPSPSGGREEDENSASSPGLTNKPENQPDLMRLVESVAILIYLKNKRTIETVLLGKEDQFLELIRSLKPIIEQLHQVRLLLHEEQRNVAETRTLYDTHLQCLKVMSASYPAGSTINTIYMLSERTRTSVSSLMENVKKIQMSKLQMDQLLAPFDITPDDTWNWLKTTMNIDTWVKLAHELMEKHREFKTNIEQIAAVLLGTPEDYVNGTSGTMSLLISNYNKKRSRGCPIHGVNTMKADIDERKELIADLLSHEKYESETRCLCSNGLLVEEFTATTYYDISKPSVEEPSVSIIK